MSTESSTASTGARTIVLPPGVASGPPDELTTRDIEVPAKLKATKPSTATSASEPSATPTPTPTSAAPTSDSKANSAIAAGAVAVGKKEGAKYQKRKQVLYQGRPVYEWEQDLEEVNMYIPLPPGITAKMIDCKITETHLKLGIKGNPPYMDQDFGGMCVVSESFWVLEDGEVHIQLQKASAAETWTCACQGAGALNAVEAQEVQQKILLERFSRENPGFDFSQATFSGAAPDPRKFMGGLDHNKLR